LHRFLNRRLRDYCPEQHLGGSLCLFIRGMHPQHPGHGIWYQPARPETVQQLSVWVETQGNKT
jgi:exodeoxyribonuclease V beta subunit